MKRILIVGILVGIFCCLGCQVSKQYKLTEYIIRTNGTTELNHKTLDMSEGYRTAIQICNDLYFSIFLNRYVYREQSYYTLKLMYRGRGWLRIKGADMMIDENSVALVDNNPWRKGQVFGKISVLSDTRNISRVGVVEELDFILQSNIVQLLQKCSSLTIGVNGVIKEPITISKVGIEKIKFFFNNAPLIADQTELVRPSKPKATRWDHETFFDDRY